MTKEKYEAKLRSWLDSHVLVIGPDGDSSDDPKPDDDKWSAHDSKQAIINAYVKGEMQDA
jgi:hypothetical protein